MGRPPTSYFGGTIPQSPLGLRQWMKVMVGLCLAIMKVKKKCGVLVAGHSKDVVQQWTYGLVEEHKMRRDWGQERVKQKDDR